MRRIIYHIAVTLDGYICHQDGSIDGFLLEGEHADDFIQAIGTYDTVLMGSKTYEFGFQYGLKAGEPAYPNLKHYIFSKSLDFKSSESVTLVRSEAINVVKDLKGIDGKDIWLCGGGELAGHLLDNGLIDQVFLKINPTVFGSGRKLFGRSKKSLNMRLIRSNPYNNGIILGEYKIA